MNSTQIYSRTWKTVPKPEESIQEASNSFAMHWAGPPTQALPPSFSVTVGWCRDSIAELKLIIQQMKQ